MFRIDSTYIFLHHAHKPEKYQLTVIFLKFGFLQSTCLYRIQNSILRRKNMFCIKEIPQIVVHAQKNLQIGRFLILLSSSYFNSILDKSKRLGIFIVYFTFIVLFRCFSCTFLYGEFCIFLFHFYQFSCAIPTFFSILVLF